MLTLTHRRCHVMKCGRAECEAWRANGPTLEARRANAWGVKGRHSRPKGQEHGRVLGERYKLPQTRKTLNLNPEPRDVVADDLTTTPQAFLTVLTQVHNSRFLHTMSVRCHETPHRPHRPQILVFRVWKRIESTCCDVKTCILEGNANDRPNYDVTWTINAATIMNITRRPRRPHRPPK